MIQIRQGIFETNSSSVHAICISKKPYVLPEKIVFNACEYGWEDNKRKLPDYLYTALIEFEDTQKLEHMKKLIESLGVECVYRKPKVIHSEWGDYYDCGIDHSINLCDFISSVFSDDDLLLRCLFSDGSYVHTGNDNSDTCPNEADEYIEEYDQDADEWVRKPNPNHKPDKFDYFEKGN